MTTELLLKGIFAAIMSAVMGFIVFSRCDEHVGEENWDGEKRKYQPYISGAILPSALITLIVITLWNYGVEKTKELMISVCFSIFLHICLYYGVLMLLLPYIRRHISARACATLWMVPNYLYYTQTVFMSVAEPLVVIRTPQKLLWVLVGVWTVGFCGVMLWKIIGHLVFRYRVLKDAKPVTDPAALAVWEAEKEKARGRKIRLVTSPYISTPMSVGLFNRWIRVVLPQRYYTEEELTLILRHEIVHIGREDGWSKFFLVFCTAMCWFNPLMWVAMRKSADDLELSCDETVLLHANEEERRRYADLILTTAGDERGFTTCLSASASALRYRLKNITRPRKRRSGGLAVSLAFFLLCMTCGYVSLTYGGGTGAELIYHGQDTGDFTLRSVSIKGDPYETEFAYPDEGAFHTYMAGLTMEKVAGSYSFAADKGRQYTFVYDTPQGTLGVVLREKSIRLTPLYGRGKTETYYLPYGVDWDYLDTLIVARPSLNVWLTEERSTHRGYISTSLWTVKDADGALCYETKTPEFVRGIYGGYKPQWAELDFSLGAAESYTMVMESWDGAWSETVTCEEGERIALPDHAARYKVFVTYCDENGELCEAQFRFELGDI